MRPILLLTPLVCLILSMSNCGRENPCHEGLIIENESDTTIVASIAIKNSDGLCRLDGEHLDAGEAFNYQPYNSCIEKNIGSTSLEIYIVAASNYNDPSEYYPCDSIQARNTILRKFELTREELQATDFRITYP